MFGLILLYVGAVLFLNGLWLTGRIGDREIAVINVFVGSLSLLTALYGIFMHPEDMSAIKGGALTLLFAFTYLWVAANRFMNVDGRGLGWFCLFVSLTAVPIAFEAVFEAQGVFGWWNAINWWVWAILWLAFFILLACAKDIQRIVGYFTILCGVFTGWIPGFLLLNNVF